MAYRPLIACRTSVVGRRFGPPKNFGVAPPMSESTVDRQYDVARRECVTYTVHEKDNKAERCEIEEKKTKAMKKWRRSITVRDSG